MGAFIYIGTKTEKEVESILVPMHERELVGCFSEMMGVWSMCGWMDRMDAMMDGMMAERERWMSSIFVTS